MDFNATIISHAGWRARLEGAVSGVERVEADEVGRTDLCELGATVGAGRARQDLPADIHDALVTMHDRFHEVAAQVARDVTAGRTDDARASLRIDGEFSRTSSALVRMLSALTAGDQALARTVEIDRPAEPRVVEPHDNPYRKGALVMLGFAVCLAAVGLICGFVLSGPWIVAFSLVMAVVLPTALFILIKNLLILPIVAPVRDIADRLHLGELPKGGVTWTARARIDEHMDRLEYRQALMTHLVASNAANVAAVADSLAAEIADVSRAAESATSATSEISDSVTSISQAVDELSAAIREISRAVENSSTLSGSVRSSMSTTARDVGQLEDAATSVSQVVELIDAIASQTNMLALNATIESARAGELGKGFAVVAGEVKDLAGETGSATRDIGERIGHIRGLSASMMTSFSSLDSDINSLDEQQSMMAAMATQQAGTVATISARASESSGALRDVTTRIGGVSSTMAGTRQLAAVSQDTARQLSGLAEEMDQLLR